MENSWGRALGGELWGESPGWRALGGERWDLQASHVLTLVVQQSRIVDPVTSSITREHQQPKCLKRISSASPTAVMSSCSSGPEAKLIHFLVFNFNL